MRKDPHATLRAENEELRLRLEEAEQALDAIRTGQVESLVVEGPDGPRIFSLEGATQSYRVLVESMNEGAATLRTDGTILYCNGRLADLVVTPLQRVMGGALSEHVPQRHRRTLEGLLERARTSSAREELPLVTSGGEEIPTYLSMSPFVDAGLPVLCLVATDLREQKRNEAVIAAERKARRSEERLRLALAFAEAGTWQWDIADDAVVWSPETYTLYGLEADGRPLTRADWSRLVHPADLDAAVKSIRACVEDGASEYRSEFRIQNPARGERWLLGIGRVERDPAGRPIRMLGLTIDITDRKRGEEALRASEERLQAAAEELRAADQRKNEFLGMLSHELRNPLAPIRNSIYILNHVDPRSAPAERAMGVIDRQVEHVTKIVDDLLDVTRIARGKIELKRSRVDLALLVRRVADDHAAVMSDRGIAFETVTPAEPLWVQGDQTRLMQVVGNVLHNAAKFTARGGRVQLVAEVVRGAAEIHVRDTGRGIQPELLVHVFEPFVQADQSLARSEGGLGLGLALVKGIVEMHGGSVRAASAGLGQGAEIVVRIPLVEEPVVDGPAVGRRSATNAGHRVLIVDDNVDGADSMAQVVETLGHTPEVAYDGPSAIAKARLVRPTVVLCDIGLPGMNGYEVARTLRAEHEGRMQIVAVTGYAQAEDVQRAMEAGFDLHLAKPVALSDVEQLLGYARASSSG